MALYDATNPRSVESFTINVVTGILSNCQSVQDLLEATDIQSTLAAIKILQKLPEDGETYTKDELATLGMWATLSPPSKGATLVATQSGATGISDLEGQLWFRIHRLVRESEYYATDCNGREDVWNYVRDLSASIVDEFATLADPLFNDGGLIPIQFGRDGLPLYNSLESFPAQGIYIETNFILHYGRHGAE